MRRRPPALATAGALAVALLIPALLFAGLGEDMAHCEASVWPKFAGWSLSRQQGPAIP